MNAIKSKLSVNDISDLPSEVRDIVMLIVSFNHNPGTMDFYKDKLQKIQDKLDEERQRRLNENQEVEKPSTDPYLPYDQARSEHERQNRREMDERIDRRTEAERKKFQ